ncbi:MAG: preprotein translocase subunit SecG [Candidatus Omnitrophica bacterium]|nr:preprotein translocase subunit SecG [Candidatus Omnitrophota bacterium]MCG2706683.1 preprotein translocase subunit SecG [Candidatus Omnitrophota bacterium]
MGLLIVIHVIACALLIIIILVQRGRGGGLVESFSGVESMFGTKTNAFLNRTTTVLATLFFISCLTLAFLSSRQSKSLMRDVKSKETVQQVVPEEEQTQEPTAQPETQEVPGLE